MFRRLVPMLMVAVLLSLMLVACGDDTTAIPTYPNATSVAVPVAVQTQFLTTGAVFKNPTFTAFNTTDDSATAKTKFASAFTNSGWVVVNTNSAVPSSFEQTGMFLAAYNHGNKSAITLVFPASMAAPFGFTNVTSGSLLLIISGNQK